MRASPPPFRRGFPGLNVLDCAVVPMRAREGASTIACRGYVRRALTWPTLSAQNFGRGSDVFEKGEWMVCGCSPGYEGVRSTLRHDLPKQVRSRQTSSWFTVTRLAVQCVVQQAPFQVNTFVLDRFYCFFILFFCGSLAWKNTVEVPYRRISGGREACI